MKIEEDKDIPMAKKENTLSELWWAQTKKFFFMKEPFIKD